jgi:hypothetical protein
VYIYYGHYIYYTALFGFDGCADLAGWRGFTKTGKPEIARLRVALLKVVCFPLSGHDRFS